MGSTLLLFTIIIPRRNTVSKIDESREIPSWFIILADEDMEYILTPSIFAKSVTILIFHRDS